MLHGDGATNITNLDSLNHFGFFADMPLLREFAQEFQDKWDNYATQRGTSGADLHSHIRTIEDKREAISILQDSVEIDLSDSKFLDVITLIRELLYVDREYPTGWDTIRSIQRRFKLSPVCEVMLSEWCERNPDVANGFDVLITNPPFGRQSDLMIDDVFILSQYKLATEVWVRDMSKTMTESLLSRTLAKEIGLSNYYISLLQEKFSKEYLEEVDEVSIDRLTMRALQRLASAKCIENEGLRKKDLVDRLTDVLGRESICRIDNIRLNEVLTPLKKA
jgi:hypothetical protein